MEWDAFEKACPKCGWFIRDASQVLIYCPGCSRPLPEGFYDNWQAGDKFNAPTAASADWMMECRCPNNCAHASDCAVHNGPAFLAGGCDCSVAKTRAEYLEFADRLYRWPLTLDGQEMRGPPRQLVSDLERASALIKHLLSTAPQPEPAGLTERDGQWLDAAAALLAESGNDIGADAMRALRERLTAKPEGSK